MATGQAYRPGCDPTMIDAGPPAPDFTLPDQDGNPVTLSALRGHPVVVHFYPKADTPGTECSTPTWL